MKFFFKSFLFFLLLNVYSCSPIDDSQNITDALESNKIDLRINGQKPIHSIRDLSASYCCNNELTISFLHWVTRPNELDYGGSAFELKLDKNGNILSLWYKDYTDPNNEFYSAFFTPISTLWIESFEYVEDQRLKMKIFGKLFKRTSNFFEEPEVVVIDTEIEIKEFIPCNCLSFISELTTGVRDFVFNRITRIEQDQSISYEAFSTNGYQIEFRNFKETINEMPLGLYIFDELSTTERIDFKKFTGVPRAFYAGVIPEEWYIYDTSGSFEIISKMQVNGELNSTVRINFVATLNGETVIEFKDAILETQL
ncbi:hypothetical protein [Belliella pelovolcani]|uniref:Uncharacterized protein n=1 Tax=Belliella pelovolcani TaxID=529505 RepID=A0A1N7NWC5_9BACT|nr:hypothetical protein [Belliella pelovolcani]SIT02581.1 hypothetical protein SAMN05421761_11224 [Belliella pelovolcani]